MNEIFPIKVQKAVSGLLTNEGACTPELRQAVEAYAARLSGGEREPASIPPELVKFVDKVALYAYKVTDRDVQRVKDAGYSEDAIYEITLCAAVGAAAGRYERGVMALTKEMICA